jgi:hypothetical protein
MLDHHFFRRYLPNLNYLAGIPLHKFEVQHLMEDGNGGYVMAAEYVPTRNINMPPLEIIGKAEFKAKPEAIFVFRFDAGGNMTWSHWIDRRQEYINNWEYRSYSIACGANGIRLCFTYQGNSYSAANSEIRLVTLTNDGRNHTDR